MNLVSLLTSGQVARRLGVSQTRVAQLRASGVLVGQRTRLGFLYPEGQVAQVEKRRKPRLRQAKLDDGILDGASS